MSKELKNILDFIDITVKGALLNANDKERLAQWREDREKLYSALERKEKLEKVWKIIKKYWNIEINNMQTSITYKETSPMGLLPIEEIKILKEWLENE